MRNLTIKRRKTFVGCAVKMKVYIEDPYSNDIIINNVSCRKLGTLKNNEEKTFVIEDNAAKVFVIADKLSKNYCNEFYQLPAGSEDVYLTGKNKLNLASGNPFLFDNNDNEEALKNRKKGTKKGVYGKGWKRKEEWNGMGSKLRLSEKDIEVLMFLAK